ncbi:MAG: siaT 17 [Geminicoccaceae bacterium]|jgi:tripartite ATP-independent transporter DctM subunit|nr:siaT 17 [Geminicoccaceae bacterium]MCE3247671.1 siaT 17 [Geminicoccaceae bacterium]
MDIATISLLLLVGILVLIALGVPLALTTGMLGVLLVYYKFGIPGLGLVMQRMYGLATEYVIIAVPLFILMASLLERSGIARDMYDALNVWLSRMRGGVAVVTMVMAIIMAAMSGIIGGEIVLLGLVALPQMLRLGYDQNLSIGTVCAGGSLGTMIPPSIVLIVYGLITETSVHSLFIAAVIPGLMMGGIYIAYIVVRTWLNPALAPETGSAGAGLSFLERLRRTWGVLPPLALVVVVLGSIYGGITSITEAAGIGCVGALATIAARRELNLTMLLEALTQTFRAVGTIIWVTFGATILAGAYNLAGGSTYVANLIIGLELPPLGVILLMMLIFLLLGMFMDWVGIVLLAMPVFLPIVTKLGYDPVWFGILFCINMQVSFLSPPFGPAAFYLKSVAPPEINLVDIYKSFGPFICLQLLVLALVLFFPWLATALL